MAIDSLKLRLRAGIASFLERPVDIAALAAFRIFFGLMMAGAMVRFLAKGWVRELYSGPAFHFTYPGFEWVRPWPDALMHAHFILLALLALGIAAGFFYRTCAWLFLLGFTYVELLDQTTYLNHYYLISLLGGILVFLPANRAWSVDAWRKPEIQIAAVPAWCLNLLRFQIGVVYVFAGLAKCNADWLLRAEPLRIWLAARSDVPLLGPLLCQQWTAYAASWFGAGFDLSIVFFLLWPRSRRIAYALVVFFHLATWVLFNIGMFPWIMMVAATVFFPSEWPRVWLRRVAALMSKLRPRRFSGGLACSSHPLHGGSPLQHALRRANVLPVCNWQGAEATIGLQMFERTLRDTPHPPVANGKYARPRATPLLLSALGVYAAVQIGLPLRPYFAAERPAWTCANFNCAWQVMVAEKTGYAEFYAFDPVTGERWRLPLQDYLTPRQEVMMAQDPHLIRAMARRLAADLRRAGFPQIQVKVNAFATINGRPSQRFIAAEADLADTRGQPWIVALHP